MKLFGTLHKRSGSNPLPAQIILGLLSIIALTSFACATLTPKPTPTPTPTRQIGAIEIGTPELTGNKKDFAIWTGTITSQTSRQYKSNGAVVNSCTTDWITDLDFAIDSSGNLNGTGKAKLSPARNCTPLNNLVENTSAMMISIRGRKDSSTIYLQLGIISHQPTSSGDFGGYILLNSSGTCPSVAQTIQAPLTSPSTAEAQLNLSATMTGCGGSKDDVMSNQSLIKLQYRFRCSELPADINDPLLEQLCH
jgi:hypothetical protein